MIEEFNVYCDESCHLENDGKKSMILGAIWCPVYHTHSIFERIREIKINHCLSKSLEIKWNKVSPAKKDFYRDLIDYFFDEDDLHFRALIVPDKNILNHKIYNQTHDEFYYKMYFDLLKVILDPHSSYNIYIDIKDTRSQYKILKLQEVLRSSKYDFSHKIVKKVQQVRSHEVEILQLTDLLLGAVSYEANGLNTSETKKFLIDKIKHRSGYSLKYSTLFKEQKFNLFRWIFRERPSNVR
jgi:hypothetical protein